MENLFQVIHLENMRKIGNLTAEAHGKVKSTKYFPIYQLNGKEMIFKPLSKTKPHLTPLFAYSEVYWSYVIQRFFDAKTPRCYLATCHPNDVEEKYEPKGVLVESLTPNKEQLINIFDYYMEHPEEGVKIDDYINYCMIDYDYTHILDSNFVKNNPKIGEELSYQILLSILRQDQNFHYENINFFKTKDGLVVTPPIDFEYSTPFIYPDDDDQYYHMQLNYSNHLKIKYERNEIDILREKLFPKSMRSLFLKQNIIHILKNYPQVMEQFIKNLEQFIVEIPYILLNDVENFVTPLSSESWRIGHAIYKDHNMDLARKYEQEIDLKLIDKAIIFERIQDHILKFSNFLLLTLKLYQYAYKVKVTNLENVTIKDLMEHSKTEDLEWLQDVSDKLDYFTIKQPLSEKDKELLDDMIRILSVEKLEPMDIDQEETKNQKNKKIK